MSGYEQAGTVAVLGFDDGKANAVGHSFIDAMNEGLDRAVQDAQAVVLAGREGLFSGGFDLKEIGKGPEAAGQLVGRGAQMLHRIFSHPQPVVVAATGHAIAAGAFICLAADTRWAAEGDYKFGLNETAIGMSLPVFGIELANARLSRQHMTQAVTQATIYDAQDALDVGFVDAIKPADQLVDACIAEAARLGEFDGTAYAANKLAWRRPFIERIEASLG